MAKKTALFILLILVVTVNLYGQKLPLQVGDKPPKLEFERIKQGSSDEPLIWKRLKIRWSLLIFGRPGARLVSPFPHLNQLFREFADKPVTFLSTQITAAHPRLFYQ